MQASGRLPVLVGDCRSRPQRSAHRRHPAEDSNALPARPRRRRRPEAGNRQGHLPRVADYPESVAGQPIVVVAFNHSGRADAVEADTAGLRRGPEPVSVSGGSQPYLDVQTAHDLALGWGRRSFIKSLYAIDLRPEALDALIDLVATGPAEASFSVTAQGGAIARIDEDAMAFTGRAARFDLSADTSWDDAAQDELNRDWVRRAMTIVEPDATEGRYANGNSDEGPAETRAFYGDAKVARLAQLKRGWDPDNVFRLNHSISPG